MVNRRSLVAALAIIASVFVVALGAQSWDQVNGSMQLRANTGAQPLMIVDQRGTGKIASFRYQGSEVAYIDSAAFKPGTLTTDFISLNRANPDVIVTRDGAYHWSQRNGTNANRLSVANAYISSTNNESLSLDWQAFSGVGLVGTRTAATGTGRSAVFAAQNLNAASGYAGMLANRQQGLIKVGFFTAVTTNGAWTNDGTAATQPIIQLGLAEFGSSSGTQTPVAILPIYNQTGTAAATDFLINRTETAVGSGNQFLIDAQVGGSTRFSVASNGTAKGTVLQGTNSVITAGSATGLTVDSSGVLARHVYKITLARTAFVCAALTCDVIIGTLPVRTNVLSVYAELTQTFACTATCTSSTLSMQLGTVASGITALLASFDADAAVGVFGDADAELGTQMTRAAAIQGGRPGSFSATDAILARVTSGTGNIGNGSATNLSQGSVTVWIVTERLP